MDLCTRRLTKEIKAMKKDPLKDPKITIAPNEANIREMHYVLEGNANTPYEGGVYHGKLLFPKEYPLKPPSVLMLTPNGRFQPNRRLCLSMSDFHPESWNPMWSVSTILTGLYSFMIENNPTLGSIETSSRKKRILAAQSLAWNVQQGDPMFTKLFPEYEERFQAERAAAAESAALSSKTVGASSVTSDNRLYPGRGLDGEGNFQGGLMATFAGIGAIIAILAVYRFF
eukprot:CAMPEP_0172441954 /NCGR_PEP_ID=MMETSP1065-20121228/2454_1 /TAXON_ID=265537 /ORGANISM="Amphiprora paludosa, Strain CCMP125" /LENGTH=227 /DNA_ID=CAMNT_0013191587 /DNA_START=50 /DNA_END=736 /DNA_ORIENTATION=+